MIITTKIEYDVRFIVTCHETEEGGMRYYEFNSIKYETIEQAIQVLNIAETSSPSSDWKIEIQVTKKVNGKVA